MRPSREYRNRWAGPSRRRRLLAGASVVTVVAAAPGTGPSFAAQNNAAGEPNPDCTLLVPPNPLSAAGLATPYQLSATNPANGPCLEADAATAAFVQASIIDPATGKVTVYNPLVLDAGTSPAI